jgi:nitroreductase
MARIDYAIEIGFVGCGRASFDLRAATGTRINLLLLLERVENFLVVAIAQGLQWCGCIPIDPKPLEVIDGLLVCPRLGARRIEILDSQEEFTFLAARVEPAYHERSGVTKVLRSGWRRCKSTSQNPS